MAYLEDCLSSGWLPGIYTENLQNFLILRLLLLLKVLLLLLLILLLFHIPLLLLFLILLQIMIGEAAPNIFLVD